MSHWVLIGFVVLSLIVFGIIALCFKIGMDKQVKSHRQQRKKD